MQNEGADIVGAQALSSANLQKALSDSALPAIKQAVASLLADLGDPGTEPASTQRAFAQARGESDAGFAAARTRSEASIKQELGQSGGMFSQKALSEAVTGANRSIDAQKGQTDASINFQEATAGLNQTNYLLAGLSKAGGALAQGGLSFGQNAISSGQILSAINRQNQQEGATYGGLIGTALGAALAAYTGGASIPIGSALGSVVGGYVGGGY